MMFALLLRRASKLEELIIEVTFKVRHGGAKGWECRKCCTTQFVFKDDGVRTKYLI
jgi:hypothetical protein